MLPTNRRSAADHEAHELNDRHLHVEIVSLGLDDNDDDDGVVISNDFSDDEDEDEFHGLLLGEDRSSGSKPQEDDAVRRRPAGAIVVWTRPLGVMIVRSVAILLSLGIGLGLLRVVLKKDHSQDSQPPTSVDTPIVSYACPEQIAKAANDKDDIFDLYNADTERHANITHITHTKVNELLDMEYGDWGMTPHQRKSLNAHWIQWYADSLQAMPQGSLPLTIYESACGVGLTLYVILELLAERHNITGLEVYGNEYIADDVVSANRFYQEQQHDEMAFPLHLGHICHGDSTNLTFVPSDAFDLVMTGYIDPIVDPLNIQLSDHEHKEYCKSKDPKKMQIMLQEQALVEDWFAAWTGEMIRIAKPGAAIILESIAYPRCQVGDWGGVEKEWWVLAVTKYGWQIDMDRGIETMAFNPDKQFDKLFRRYNVKMIKQAR
jgi:hypothetical protein